MRRSVLIFHLGALGDFVLTWPLALGLSRVLAQHRIVYVTHAQKGKLAERVLGVESLDIEQSWSSLFAEPSDVPDAIVKRLRSSQFIFSFLSEPSDRWTKNVEEISKGASIVHLENRPQSAMAVHHSQWLLEQLSSLPLAASAVAQMLQSIRSRGIGRRETIAADVLIHPGSGGSSKCWPLEKFMALADRVKGSGRSVGFVIGEVERERMRPQEIEKMRSAFPLYEPPTLVDLHTVITSCGALLCNDSGPAHLAAICGVPTAVLFGPSDPVVWSPLGPHVSVLQADNLQNLPVEIVYNHLRGLADVDK